MASASKQVNVRLQLGSAGNLLAQELIRSRKSGKLIHLAEIGGMLDNLLQYGGTVDTEVEDVDYVRSTGAVNYTNGTTVSAYTVVIGGRTVNYTGTLSNGLTTAQAAVAAVQADAVASRWVEASAVDLGAGAGRLVLVLRAFIGNAADLGNLISLTATGVGATASAATFGTGTGAALGTNSPSTNLVGQL